MNILIIEDETSLAESIFQYLQEEGYICEIVSSYEAAYQKIHVYSYDCILVDIMLPDGNGLELINELKKDHAETGIIIISAKNSLDDKIKGLELGSDDYLTKPFHLPELNARINALMRRKYFKGDREVEIGDLTILPMQKKVFANGIKLDLTAKEYDILNYFVTNANRVLTKEAIAEHVWGDHYDMVDSFDFIYVHINNLRKKIQKAGADDPIETVYGMGYKFIAP
ncbi:MAG TPA: response regulator transcription factor [Balneolaceae bacterium]|nr:response regulator transcription factor [Balneolaceae bacterium]